MSSFNLSTNIYMLILTICLISCSKDNDNTNTDHNYNEEQYEIHVNDPGTLSSLLGNKKMKISDLTITGTLNGDDLLTLREMAGADYNYNETEGILEHIDLSGIRFVSGGKLEVNKSELTLGAFAYCKRLKTIILPEDIKVLPDYCFYKCGSLFEVLPMGEISAIGENCFYECSELSFFPKTESIRELGALSFANSSILKFNFGTSLSTIPYAAFYETPLSGDIDLSHVRVIDSLAFMHTNLNSVIFSDKLERIEIQAFMGKNYTTNTGRTLLQDLILPKSLKFLGEDAFSCTGIKSITIQSDLSVPESMYNQLLPGMFYRCDKLKRITVKEGVKKLVIPFTSCDALEEVILPSSLEIIGLGDSDHYFTDFYPGVFAHCESLKSIELPKSLTIIGDNVFNNTGLIEINIPDNVEYIGKFCFADCKDLAQIHLPKALKMINQGAFTSCQSLKSINIPNTTQYIFSDAFSNCRSLEYVTLPKDLTIHPEFEHHVIGAVPAIESSIFENCPNLLEVDMSACENIVNIDTKAFSGCSRLRSVLLPPNLKTISSSAFLQCISLKNIALPSTLTKIDSYCFSRCGSLQQIDFPISLQSIGEYAFDNCREITSISWENELEHIGQYCFNECIHLNIIKSNKYTPIEIDNTTFNNIALEKVMLSVPASSVEKYKEAAVWKKFGSIIPIM